MIGFGPPECEQMRYISELAHCDLQHTIPTPSPLHQDEWRGLRGPEEEEEETHKMEGTRGSERLQGTCPAIPLSDSAVGENKYLLCSAIKISPVLIIYLSTKL